MGLMKRQGGPSPTADGLKQTEWARAHRALVEFLADVSYADGSVRRPGTLTVFVEDGMAKVCLNDRDVGETAWYTADTIEGAILGASVALAGDALAWRRPYTSPGRKR